MNRVKKLILVAGIIGMTLNNIDAQNSVAPIIKSNPEVVILFYKPGCPYYQYIAPHFSALTNECHSWGILFKTVDISSQDRIYKNAYHFNTVPTVIYFKNGAPALSHGSNNKTITTAQMKNNIRTVFGK